MEQTDDYYIKDMKCTNRTVKLSEKMGEQI